MPEAWRKWGQAKTAGQADRRPAGAKHLKTRRWNVRRHGVAVLVIATAILILGTWYLNSHVSAPAAQAPSTTDVAQTDVGSTTLPNLQPVFIPAIDYPGQQPGDIVANNAGTVSLAGESLTLAGPSVSPTLLGRMLLCVSVAVHNGSGKGVGYGAVNWAVQSPSGSVEHPASLGVNEVLVHGQVVPGRHVTGKVCFEEPGQAGLYVLSYIPRPVSPKAAKVVARLPRAIWLLKMA
jgi:hypothetical protein